MATKPTKSPATPVLSEACKSLLLEYWNDKGNWSGTPLVGGNVDSSTENNGYITDLKKKGLITTWNDGRNSDGTPSMWMEFTDLCRSMMRECCDCGEGILAGEPWNRCDACARA